MSKVIDATCDENSKVTAAGIEVPAADVTILSEGKQDSSGVLIIQGLKAYYLTSSATDIKSTIDKTAESLEKIANILTSIGAGMTGATTAPPPTLAADVAEITVLVSELNTLKGALK